MIPPNEFIHFAMFGPIGVPELLIIVLIIALLFGASKIPKLARGLGQGINEFKRGLKDNKVDDSPKEIEEETKKNGD